jgi:hypothetical protein
VTRSVAEVIILTINALGAGILLFIAGVIQKLMDGMDALAFKSFLNCLGRSAMRSPFAVTIATLPIIAAILVLRGLWLQPLVVHGGLRGLADWLDGHKDYQHARLQMGWRSGKH